MHSSFLFLWKVFFRSAPDNDLDLPPVFCSQPFGHSKSDLTIVSDDVSGIKRQKLHFGYRVELLKAAPVGDWNVEKATTPLS